MHQAAFLHGDPLRRRLAASFGFRAEFLAQAIRVSQASSPVGRRLGARRSGRRADACLRRCAQRGALLVCHRWRTPSLGRQFVKARAHCLCARPQQARATKSRGDGLPWNAQLRALALLPEPRHSARPTGLAVLFGTAAVQTRMIPEPVCVKNPAAARPVWAT